MSGDGGSLPVASRWFEVTDVGQGVTQITEPYVEPLVRSNAWLVRGRDADLLVDTGLGVSSLAEVLDRDPGRSLIAVATHSHFDHVGGLGAFTRRAIHRLEADDLAQATDPPTLSTAVLLADVGDDLPERWLPRGALLLTARPHVDFDPLAFAPDSCAATELLEEGDVIDLGDRAFEILHLPGHSPGSVGLWSAPDGILFSGDAVYRDQPILDQLPGSSVEDYVATMYRLREMPVSVVHAGHDPSFGAEALTEIVGRYLEVNDGA